jgi:hypothetical protein
MPTQEEVFEYLYILRDSGVTNMFSAPFYLMDYFKIGRGDAIKFFTDWVREVESC